MSIEEHVFRPLRYLAETKRAIPWPWREIDRVRSHRNWPEWCFLPTGVLSRILSSNPHSCHADECKPDIVAALAAWRATQGIYRFDEDLFRAVWTTSLDSQIPAEILLRMPEWSAYVVTHGCTVGNEKLFGFFAHLDFLPLGNHPELRIVLNLGGTHLCSLLPIDLTTVSIEDALETTRQRMLRELAGFVDMKELLLTVARTAECVGARDQRCVGQIHAVTDRLQAIASLEDITEIRASIEKSSAELRNSIQRMSDEGKAAMEQPHKQVHI